MSCPVERIRDVVKVFGTIGAKLYLIIGLAAVGIVVLAVAAQIGASRMAASGKVLHEVGLQGTSQVARIELLLERSRGLVAGAPAELDLEKLARKRLENDALLAEIDTAIETYQQGADQFGYETSEALRGDLALVKEAAGQVFDFAGSFAQAQAIEVLTGAFAAADAEVTKRIRALVDHTGERAQQEMAALEAAGSAMSLIVIFVGLAALASAGGAGFAISRNITSRTKSLTQAMTALANNDIEIEIPATGSGDEIGAMARSVEVFKGNAIEKRRLQAEQAENEKRAEEEKARAMRQMADELEASVKTVVQSVARAAGELQSTAKDMSGNVDQTNQQSNAVASAAEQASANVQTVAAAAEEMSSSINEVSNQVSRSTEIASEAIGTAEKTNTTMQSLAEMSQQIGEVVSLINDIAEQTNLLALNATIEAARAGDAGKGFAVVASEVKSLASQTAKATEQIAAQIGEIQSVSQEAVTAIDQIRSVIGRMGEMATAVAAAIDQQSASTREISRNAQHAATGTQEVTESISSIREATEATGHATNDVVGAADVLTGMADELSGKIDRFVAGVRSA